MQAQDEDRLKTAAVMADSGELRDLTERLWKGDQTQRPKDLMRSVS